MSVQPINIFKSLLASYLPVNDGFCKMNLGFQVLRSPLLGSTVIVAFPIRILFIASQNGCFQVRLCPATSRASGQLDMDGNKIESYTRCECREAPC